MEKAAHPTRDSLQEYGRGIAGGLIFSLPLLYTMEVWWAGFVASPERLLIHFAAAFGVLMIYNRFAGLHSGASLAEVVVDSVEELGIGTVIAAVVLFLAGQLEFSMHWSEVLGKIIVEALTVAVGVSIGTAQLGQGDDGSGSDESKKCGLRSELALCMCGAVLIAGNVAPTDEIVRIAIESAPLKIVAVAVLSMGVVALILHGVNFRNASAMHGPDRLPSWLFSLAATYAIALGVSMYMLWFFGRFGGMSLEICAAMIVVLGFAAALGASAGRLLIRA